MEGQYADGDLSGLEDAAFLTPLQLDPSLIEFMEQNKIPLDAYNITQLFRFIRYVCGKYIKNTYC